VPTFFLDSSAIAKRYVTEAGSAWIIALTEATSRNVCWLTAVTRVEVAAGLYRRHRMGHLTAIDTQRAVAAFLHEYAVAFRVLAVDSVILDSAVKLVGAHPIRAYDALQLGGAIRLRAEYERAGLLPPVFVSSDQALNRAALAEGMVIEDPTAHP
jgi:predicted nucleic acid-binding protein